MSLLDAVLLGVLQGLTEFLPVSSSGHLVVAGHALGARAPESGLLFEVVVHLGTLAAVVVAYGRDLWQMTLDTARALPALLRGRLSEAMERPHARLGLLVVIGTVPTALIGLLLEDLFESLFSNLIAVGVAFLVTGALLLVATTAAKRRSLPPRELPAMRVPDALLVGLLQGAAITPGISRSGATIATAMLLGIDRELAARFSFLLSVPAILGALVLQLRDGLPSPDGGWAPYALGFLVAAVSGYLALRFLLALLVRGRFGWFTAYLWPLGLATIAWALLG